MEACRACGGPLAPSQEYCLECGARIERPEGVAHSLGVAWQRRIPWYPGDWVWPALAALLVAAAGAAAAVAADRGGPAEPPQTIVALSKLVKAPARPAAKPTPKPRPASPTAPQPKPAPKPKQVISWPDRDGATIVLASIPLDGGAIEAREKARDALAKGLPVVGILVSSRFSSLHPGYYVVFSGVYASLEQAQQAVSGVTQKFPQAYAREIAR